MKFTTHQERTMPFVYTICIDGCPQEDEYTDADKVIALAEMVKGDDPDAIVTVLITEADPAVASDESDDEADPTLAERLRGFGATERVVAAITAHYDREATDAYSSYVTEVERKQDGRWYVVELIVTPAVTYNLATTFGARGASASHVTFAHVYHSPRAAAPLGEAEAKQMVIDERVRAAERAVRSQADHADFDGGSDDDGIVDLLANLMHLVDARGAISKWDALLERAQLHFEEEA